MALPRTRRRTVPALVVLAFAATVALTAAPTATAGPQGPQDLAGADVLSPAGITSRGGEVVVVSGDGGDVRSISGGQQSVIGDGLARGRFTNGATGVAVNRAGDVFVASADEGAVHVFRAAGGRSIHATGLGAPVGLAFSDSGDLYVADAGGRRVLRVSPQGEVFQVAGGYAERPFGLAFGPGGELFVTTQRDGKVFRIARDGTSTEHAATGGSAEGIVVDRSGALYVGDGQSGNVVRIASAGAAPEPVLEGQNGPIWLGATEDGRGLLVSIQETKAETEENPITGAETSRTPTPEGHRVLSLPVDAALLPAQRPQVAPRDVPLAAGTQAFRAGGESVAPATALPVADRSDIGREAAEPTVAVTKEGNVFIPAATFDGVGRLARTEIRASYDRGETWQTVGGGNEFANPPITLDPYIYVDPLTDRIFNDDLTLACSYLSFSDDQGKTFTVNPAACGQPVNDHQSISTGPPITPRAAGYPNNLYYCGINQIFATTCARSVDGGRTFTPGGIAFPGVNPGSDNLFCGGLAGHNVVGPDGTLYVPRVYCDVPSVAISRNEGLTFQIVTVSDVQSQLFDHESAIALDSAGNAYYTWIGFDRLPRLAVSRDGGRTWGEPLLLTSPELAQGNLPAIAAFGPGQVAVSFYGSANRCCYEVDEEEPGDRDNSQGRWSTYVYSSSNALDASPTFYSTTVDPRTDPSVKGGCGPGRCGNALDFLGVVVDPTGEVWSSSVDTCTPEPGDPTGTGVEGNCVADPTVPQNNRRGIAAHFALPGAQPGAAFPESGLVGGVAAVPAAGGPPAGARADGQATTSRGTGSLAATGAPLLALPALLLVGSAVLLRRRSARHRG